MNKQQLNRFGCRRFAKPFGDIPIAMSWILAVALFAMLAGAVVGAFTIVMIIFGLPLKSYGPTLGMFIVSLFLPFWMALANFFTAPLFQLMHRYNYHSPMLIAIYNRRGGLDIHGGTLFDYFKHFRWSEKGERARQRVLCYYCQGMLSIVNEIEKGQIPDHITISATSYFFSPQNAEQLGFTVRAKGILHASGGFLNYPMLVLAYSFAKGRLSFPNLHHTVSADISGAELVKNKEMILKMVSWFSNCHNMVVH